MSNYQKIKWLKFDGPYSYHEYLSKIPLNCFPGYNYSMSPDAFYGLPRDKALKMLITGDHSNEKQINEILSQMQDEQIFASGLPIPTPSLMGNAPRIAAVLAGHPKSMSRRIWSENISINTPLKVCVDVGVSAGVQPTQIVNRGVSIMAFCMAMSQIRPVELICFAGTQVKGIEVGQQVNYGVSPFDTSLVSFALTNTAYLRRLDFAASVSNVNAGFYSFSGEWSWRLQPMMEEYQRRMRIELEMTEEDVLITGGYVIDKLMLTDPVAWVKKMIYIHNVKQYEENEV